ncbi:MAG: hypothetical protein OXI49_00180 [Acidobacteriota bacterium]|nr:hypothetical protein [Acidobacteriota bacterium]
MATVDGLAGQPSAPRTSTIWWMDICRSRRRARMRSLRRPRVAAIPGGGASFGLCGGWKKAQPGSARNAEQRLRKDPTL